MSWEAALHSSSFDPAEAAEIVRSLANLEGPLLPVLHALQERFGFVGEAAIRVVSAELNLSRAEVHGVVSFYHDFHEHPRAGRVVKLCRAEACQARGGDRIAERFEDLLQTRIGDTSPSGAVSLEACYCLGLCAIGPNALVDGRPVARLTDAKVAMLAAEVGR